MLRKWQAHCLEKAMRKYKKGEYHFFCQATPGSGKTVLAAAIASKLIQDDMVDLILCFSPSLTIADGIKRTFSKSFKCAFQGGLGSIGQSLTYQSIQFLGDEFWQTLLNYRVFVVFDEIHHCSGNEVNNGNVWGQQILTKIQRLATYTLAMSGTPWRSDALPIVMSEYSDPGSQILVDYQYTLKQAVRDNVCRVPNIVLVDNEHLSVRSDGKIESFSSILEMIKHTKASYQSFVNNQVAMEYLLSLGCKKLAEIRSQSPSAGGLVVASSVQHAKAIKKILCHKYAQTASIVTYYHDDPLAEIERYRHNNTQWIVSIGMISEGTDIPRLQVCCHMSSVKTELYFRQVLGRILRVNGNTNQDAWLFTFAEKNMIDFSERVEQDIPESSMYVKIPIRIDINFNQINDDSLKRVLVEEDIETGFQLFDGTTIQSHTASQRKLDTFDEVVLGNFRQRVISAFLAMQ
ncbi:FOG: GGDEF domain protein [Vibrio nigripulchritudo POn4]|uniref:DEAD/DEAH box helicase n=1 Tax=Vibrio nigripulchritudo TaxID=28173 RepID=UPI0003B1CFE1|nr:DEAD/DEAH box helicase family protein [Vibrio nigripulchritudo]CCN63545.1 FOG: GGDEF domain protein [Vibrio nigripulchritudo POn4]